MSLEASKLYKSLSSTLKAYEARLAEMDKISAWMVETVQQIYVLNVLALAQPGTRITPAMLERIKPPTCVKDGTVDHAGAMEYIVSSLDFHRSTISGHVQSAFDRHNLDAAMSALLEGASLESKDAARPLIEAVDEDCLEAVAEESLPEPVRRSGHQDRATRLHAARSRPSGKTSVSPGLRWLAGGSRSSPS